MQPVKMLLRYDTMGITLSKPREVMLYAVTHSTVDDEPVATCWDTQNKCWLVVSLYYIEPIESRGILDD